jgi:hypothetical protein
LFCFFSAHYIKATQESETIYYTGSALSVWFDALRKVDPDFVEQSERIDYVHGYHGSAVKPNLQEGEVLLLPKLSYSAAMKFIKRHDVSFGKLRVDVCSICERFKQARADASPETLPKLLEVIKIHLTQAQTSYDIRNANHALDAEDPTYCCRDVDYAGSLRVIDSRLPSILSQHDLSFHSVYYCGPQQVSFCGSGPGLQCCQCFADVQSV